MSDLAALTAQRDNLLKKIHEIEVSCEGTENENNAKRIQELNLAQAQYSAQRQEIATKLAVIDEKLADITAGIMELGETGVEKILEAIKNQRWYFIKNNHKILFDKNSGLLWANLHTFNYVDKNKKAYLLENVNYIINNYSFGFTGFRLPTGSELYQAVEDKTIPFHTASDKKRNLFGRNEWACEYNGKRFIKNIDSADATSIGNGLPGYRVSLFPCSDDLIQNSDYQEKVQS